MVLSGQFPTSTNQNVVPGGNVISRNSIFGDARLGITTNSTLSLDGSGGVSFPNVTQDPLDADAGPNGLQNIPLLLSAVAAGANTSVHVRLTTAANTTYHVEFFSNPAPGAFGYGEGETYLTTLDLTTDGSGVVDQTVQLPAVAAGQFISATDTGPDGTSQFSRAREVQDPAANLSLVVTNTNDGGAGSLRQAILNANLMPNGASPDTITFNIPGPGVHTIQPLTALPLIVDPLVIDGYSQPGASANTLAQGDDAKLLVEIDGSQTPAGTDGLRVGADDSAVRGLVINRFQLGNGNSVGLAQGAAITLLPAATNDVIAGNFIGTDAAGAAALGNGFDDVLLVSAPGNRVGGTAPADRNLISGSPADPTNSTSSSGLVRGNGVNVFGLESTGNVIQGNYVGTDATGTLALANGGAGVVLGAGGNTVGGTDPAARNLLSGNRFGVEISGDGGTADLVQGNYIGTTIDGVSALPNSTAGVLLSGAIKSTIGGTAAGAGNLISGNGGAGIRLINQGQVAAIDGNLIGTDVTGNGLRSRTPATGSRPTASPSSSWSGTT